jgi:RNA polymerase sigma-70 factor (ECF subfamily)
MSMTLAKTAGMESDDQRDRELLHAIAARDQRALEQLYRLYHRRLVQFLARLPRARESVEEAINETFWVVWCQAQRFRGASRVSTWITGIAWRCALSAQRRDGGYAPRSQAPVPEPEEAPETAALETLLREERADWLAQGLSSLPFEQRATLELAYYLGHSCAEIAEIMECPVNTVKARLFQARIKLRNLLPRLGGDARAPGGV